MFSYKSLALAAVSFAVAGQALAAGEQITKEEMIKFVDEAAAFAKKVGKEAAVKELNDQKGKFWRHNGELYIFGYNMDGVNVVHPQKPALVGKNLMGLKDPKGTAVVKGLIDSVNNKEGKGEFVWMWENPASKKVEPKHGYSVKIVDPKGDWFLGSGVHLPQK